MSGPVRLAALGVASCLGLDKASVADALFAGRRPDPLGVIADDFAPALPVAWNSRNNRLLRALAEQIRPEVEAARARFGRHRLAVVIGTSTSGIAEGEAAIGYHKAHGALPDHYRYSQQETGSGAHFLADHLEIDGPAWVVATACSSAAKALASARRLLQAGLADAVVSGGADTLCAMTRAGFASLESVDAGPCNPFSLNRRGITIGEGGALFLLTRDEGGIQLLGVGESSDAHHISAPDPSGAGAVRAMELALQDAGLAAGAIAYVNLHGTATPQNDAMESKAVAGLLGANVPASSTKALTGHTLGAAGAVEAAICWLALSADHNPQGLVPPHVWDGAQDPDLAPLCLAPVGMPLGDGAILSNSFAFGGSNCALIFGGRG
jgi:3-oxoacyl-[acyl-carrier-protein] synthase-1